MPHPFSISPFPICFMNWEGGSGRNTATWRLLHLGEGTGAGYPDLELIQASTATKDTSR